MVAVKSTMQELGSPASHFRLPDVRDHSRVVDVELSEGKPVLLMFICNHCPYVIHVVDKMAEIANSAQLAGYAVYAISSNDAKSYPQDGPDAMADFAVRYGFEFPYLYDETQDVAKSYRAACTPDFYVFDNNHRLQYRGQMDGSRPGNDTQVTGHDLLRAITAISAVESVPDDQIPSVGCNIKWRSGNEPDYF